MEPRERAVVIGGGISGKIAARVLSDFFNEVVILEQDQEEDSPSPRKGVRQGEHLHALLHAGQYGLEQLFPGITENFYQSGAIKINSTQDLAWFHHGVWKLRYDGGYTTALQTRPHLEWHIEQYIKQIPNVLIEYNQVVRNFLFNKHENRIYGVELLSRDKSIKNITADLIVDASGASSLTTNWLQKQKITIPTEKVEIGLTYVSKFFHLPENKHRDWEIKLVYPNPPHEKIGGTLSKVEGNRYIATMMGYQNKINGREVIGTDEAFLALAKKLPRTDIYQEIKKGEPLSQTSVYRVPHISWKRFDKVRALPRGVLLIGDTVCRIDPVFGQGMSIVVLEGLLLQKILRNKRSSINKSIVTFHRKVAKIISPIWHMVTLEISRYPEIARTKSFGLSFQHWYIKRIYFLSSEDKQVYDSFIKVMNLIKPPTILFHPSIIRKVLKR